jgi:spermidine synthase
MSQAEFVSRWRWQLLFSAAGALALGLQTYLLREFLVVLQGDEMAVGLGLAAWFVGISVGAGAARRSTAHAARTVAGAMLALLGTFGYAEVVVARFARDLAGLSAFEPLSLAPSLTLAGGLFLVPGFCVGAAFVALATTASNALGSARHAIGSLYVFEACGSLIAGLVTSLVLTVYLSPLRGAGLLVGFALLAMLPAAVTSAIAGRTILLLSALVTLVPATTPLGIWLERTTENARFSAQSMGRSLLAFRSTPYQHIALGGKTEHVLYANGQYVSSFPDPAEQELLAHELMLFSEHPTRVLSFGGLETGLLRFCLKHPVVTLDLVLLDADAFHLLTPYLSPDDRAALQNPRVHVVFEDPRRYLNRNGQAYDLILSLEPDPNTLFLARTTSLEYVKLVRSRLSRDGAYVSRFSAGPNVQTGALGLLGATLYRTHHDVFPVVRATPGPEALLVAGNSITSVTIDATRLEQRYRARAILSEVFVPELLPELLPPERIETLNHELERSSQRVHPARDDRPIAFLHALSVRQRISNSVWASLLNVATQHPKWLLTVLLTPSSLLLLWTGLRRRSSTLRVAALHATTVTGACGLTVNLLLFVSFQTRVGALYSELGALSGLFMLGLAVGGVVSTRDTTTRPLLRAQQRSWLLSVLLLGSLGLVDRLPLGGFGLWLLHVLLLLCAGGMTGLLFPAASRECLAQLDGESTRHAGKVASNLELWDHAGAALAALLAAVLLIPTLGLLHCMVLLVALQSLALVQTWLSHSPKSHGD